MKPVTSSQRVLGEVRIGSRQRLANPILSNGSRRCDPEIPVTAGQSEHSVLVSFYLILSAWRSTYVLILSFHPRLRCLERKRIRSP